MKPGRYRTEHDEPERERQDSDVVGREACNNPEGFDAIRALQMIAGGFIIIFLIWYVLHTVFRVV